ncbi:MAG: NAD(P)H-dependent oxidoreductase [Bacteroidales bacterium]|nr:NAD(P)H-dependent oxidoreductase [Bacteroidales bacterium]
MNTLLYISSSIFGEHGKSTELAGAFVRQLAALSPASQVIHRDLATQPVPHLDSARFTAFTTPVDERSPAQQAVVDFSDGLIDEWRRADTVVLGLPMYNMGLPSTLKAYIDHIARAGETFRYTANGPEGLLPDRKVYVIATRGGQYQNTELDTQSGYIRHILGLMGVTDIEFIYAEGLNMGSEIAEQALRRAREFFAGRLAA